MAVHRGRPEDLPPAEVIWARWAALAAVLSPLSSSGVWLDDDGLHLGTPGDSWAAMAWAGEGRAVLFGDDKAGAAKWYEPPIDALAGAPDWLPYEQLEDHLEGGELGFVYWYENTNWHRTPYPGDLDDGLTAAIGGFLIRTAAALEMEHRLHVDRPAHAACERLLVHAERRTVTAEVVRGFADRIGRPDADVTGILATARRAGITRRPPAGHTYVSTT
ncbi:hypothetical protein NE236_29935 [Actinoallomurus purpureus]|uniref:hypothetical protein n=1 Tax=Actinoallomurus purpureus TaxID=478114 RepID=UPI002092E785|nr:hypothetical protein [Actinoallomurus purpureus]MCO6009198.1 hypothetical protein [Actinoallomurus purpureus]